MTHQHVPPICIDKDQSTSSTPQSSSASSSPPPSSSSTPPPATTAAATSTSPSSSSPPTSSPSSTWTPTPVTTVEVTTVSGAVVTQTVTSTPTVPPQSYLQPQRENKGLSGGAIGGIAVGAFFAIALLATGLLVLFFRRRRSGNDVERPPGGRFSPVRKWIPGRQASVLSRTGLLSSEPGPVHEKPELYVNTNQSQMSRRPSVGASAMMGESAPHSASTATAERRNSRLMFVDQRLNPNALMMGDNGSQTSIGTMQDNRDYTRPLGVS
ncbi:MAG: hypothetical protein M1821_001625 [Bathelium mastoideum]|nr:MAG: hypothetical protein M1821_001625 [Bathelium mastoideum]